MSDYPGDAHMVRILETAIKKYEPVLVDRVRDQLMRELNHKWFEVMMRRWHATWGVPPGSHKFLIWKWEIRVQVKRRG